MGGGLPRMVIYAKEYPTQKHPVEIAKRLKCKTKKHGPGL